MRTNHALLDSAMQGVDVVQVPLTAQQRLNGGRRIVQIVQRFKQRRHWCIEKQRAEKNIKTGAPWVCLGLWRWGMFVGQHLCSIVYVYMHACSPTPLSGSVMPHSRISSTTLRTSLAVRAMLMM
jgi:hypothetical protein